MKLPIYQIKETFKNELKAVEQEKPLPSNQYVKEPLLDEKYAPSDTQPNEFMNTDPEKVPERQKPKYVYDSRYTEQQ